MPFFLLSACMGINASPDTSAAPQPGPVDTPTVTQDSIKPPGPSPQKLVSLPPVKPSRLKGLNPKQVQALVGPPSLVRRDGPVQVMLFETKSCVFEVIFFEPQAGAYFRAQQVQARTLRGHDTDAAACLARVLPNGQWLDDTSGLG